MNIVIAPDSFKGSMTMVEVADAMTVGIQRVFPDAHIDRVPVADGGEGTVESILSMLSGERISLPVLDPMGRPIHSYYGYLDSGIAIIEMALACGLPLVAPEHRDVMKATTYGVGQLIRSALDKGCKKIMIGIGGSATNDAGVGMAQALGVHFLDKDGQEVGFGGGALGKIAVIDDSGLDPRIAATEITILSDVTNPLCGTFGASQIYGKQKGASPEQIEILDQNLAHFGRLVAEKYGIDYAAMNGAGAAGGLGMGLMAFLNAEMHPGIQEVLRLVEFDKKAAYADLIVTGEGRIDGQTAYGKVLVGIAQMAARYGTAVVAVGGCITEDSSKLYDMGISAMISTYIKPMAVEVSMKNAKVYVADATERLMRAIKLGATLARKPQLSKSL